MSHAVVPGRDFETHIIAAFIYSPHAAVVVRPYNPAAGLYMARK